jgi:Domain of unknown function (DUF5625)
MRLPLIWICLLVALTATIAVSQVPTAAPIHFTVGAVVEFPVSITRHRVYDLNVLFEFDNMNERNLVRKIVGDAYNVCHVRNECGESSHLKITIKSGETVILDQDTQPRGHHGFGQKAFFRKILSTPLRPGRYTIRTQVLNAGPSIENMKTYVQFTSDPRRSDLGD